MRILIVSLIFANLAFAAWALLIDRPFAAPAARDISRLPRLVLEGEPPPGTVNSAAASSGPHTAAPGAAPSTHCVTVGPFNDLVLAAAANALLQTRGLKPTQRDEPGQDLTTYWVYLDNVPSDAAATRLLQKLHGTGLADAHVMPLTKPEEPRRVSVGLFNEHGGAERRARLVKASLGVAPVITEQHQPQAAYWIDMILTSPAQSVSTEGLLPAAAEGGHLEIRDCPAPASSAPAPAGASPK